MRIGRAHIIELLRSHGPIAKEIDRRQAQDGLLGEVRAQLPVTERPHCLQATRHEEVLSLTLDSAAWATRIRYRIPDLLNAFGPTGVTCIRVRIQPPGQSAGARLVLARSAHRARLSAEVVGHLLAAADQIDDPGIAQVWRRLARRHGGSEISPPMD